MASYLLILTLFAAGSLALPAANNKARDDSLDNYIKAILEQLKAAMPNGIPELGIPVLDPFDVPHFDIPHISESGAEIDVTIDNFVITNMATFETTLAHVDITALSLELGLKIPLLRGDADYTLDGSIFSLFPLYGDGPMYVILNELLVGGKAGVTLDTEGYLQVYELTLDATFDSIDIHFDNLVGGGNFGEVINQVLSLLGPQIWDLVKDDVFKELNGALLSILNDALHKCSINDIINNTCEIKNYL